MNDLNQHDRQLLGLDASWNVDDVDLDLLKNQVVIRLSHAAEPLLLSPSQGRASHATHGKRRWTLF